MEWCRQNAIVGCCPRAPLWYTHDMDTTICILVCNVNTLSASLFCLTCKFQEEEETLRLDTGSQMMLDGQLDAMEKGLRLVWFSNTRVTLFKTENGHREAGLVLRCRLNGCLPHTEADPRGEAGARGWGWGGGKAWKGKDGLVARSYFMDTPVIVGIC